MERHHNKTFIIIGTFVALVAMTMTVFAIDKKRVAYYCSDVRLYMDGGYAATITRGGLNPKTHVEFYRAFGFGRDQKKLDLASEDVDRVQSRSDKQLASPNLRVSIDDKWVQDRGYLTVVDAKNLKSDRGVTEAKLWCRPPMSK